MSSTWLSIYFTSVPDAPARPAAPGQPGADRPALGGAGPRSATTLPAARRDRGGDCAGDARLTGTATPPTQHPGLWQRRSTPGSDGAALAIRRCSDVPRARPSSVSCPARRARRSSPGRLPGFGSVRRPAEAPGDRALVTVYLYRVAIDTVHRNRAPRRSPDGQLQATAARSTSTTWSRHGRRTP